MCVVTHQERVHFFEMINLISHMPRLTLKNECIPIYLIGNTRNVYWNPQNRVCFYEMIDLRGHMTRFSWKMNVFPSIFLETAINGSCNSQNRACFSKMIDLISHMPRFTLKVNVFPSILLELPEMCVEGIRTGSFLQDDQFEVICLGLSKNEHFPVYLLGTTINVWLKPSEQGLFFQDNRFEGSHALGSS